MLRLHLSVVLLLIASSHARPAGWPLVYLPIKHGQTSDSNTFYMFPIYGLHQFERRGVPEMMSASVAAEGGMIAAEEGQDGTNAAMDTEDGQDPMMTSQNGMDQNGMVQNGMGQNGMSQNGMDQNGMVQNGMGQNGMSQNGMVQNGMKIDSTAEMTGSPEDKMMGQMDQEMMTGSNGLDQGNGEGQIEAGNTGNGGDTKDGVQDMMKANEDDMDKQGDENGMAGPGMKELTVQNMMSNAVMHMYSQACHPGGEYLINPNDQCSFLWCVNGMLEVVMCPPGTKVSTDYVHDHTLSPCGEIDYDGKCNNPD